MIRKLLQNNDVSSAASAGRRAPETRSGNMRCGAGITLVRATASHAHKRI